MEAEESAMAEAQTTETVGNVKIDRCGSSVRLRQMDGTGNEVYVDFDDLADVVAVMQGVAEDAVPTGLESLSNNFPNMTVDPEMRNRGGEDE